MAGRILTFDEAVACVQQHAASLAWPAAERVPLELATGRVLAQPIVADRDMPPFARSTRDGYALRAASTGPWQVLGEVRAGESWAGAAVCAETCVAIMTGAPLPEGADCVLMLEHSVRAGDTLRAESGRTLSSGQNVVAAGSEARRGKIVLDAGTRLGPAHIGLAAACGCAHVQVFRRPKVAVLATGDELVQVAETPGAAQIRNSNSYALAAAVQQCGAVEVVLEPARDSAESLREQLQVAFDCDLVLVAGGVSAGKYDLAEQVLMESFGAEFFFTAVRMQPGRPVVFGRASAGDAAGKYFFGLPGNPISALVTFEVLARHLLAAMCGQQSWSPRFALAHLETDIEVAAGLTRFMPALVTNSPGGTSVRRVAWQGSGDMAAHAASNAYIVVPEQTTNLAAGQRVTIWLQG